ncbi:MAG: hypothetical protein ACLS8R_04510 [Anaeromassilibacillus sp.]
MISNIDNNLTDMLRIIISSSGTIISAFISAVALIKVNRIDNQDKIRRSLWAFEEYLLMLGKYIKSPTPENLENYTALYLLNLVYTDDKIKAYLKIIDQYIEENHLDTVKLAVDDLIKQYTKTYKMKSFWPKKSFLQYLKDLFDC